MMYEILNDVKNGIATVEGIKSLKIGFEKGCDISSNTPLVRIVSEGTKATGTIEDLTIQIIVAFDLKNDLEQLYKDFYALEAKIKSAVLSLPYQIVLLGTIMDEDKLKALKSGIIRIKVLNIGMN